jgi:hypothetical protein
MLIAYLTTDEVNQHLAMHMAEGCGETVCLLTLSDPPPDEDFDAVVYDWDYLPAARQQAILAELLAGRSHRPVAVHGYNLEDDCVEALRRQHVAVYRVLQPEVFQLLAVQSPPPADAQCSSGPSGEPRETSGFSEAITPPVG